jgi:uncharacterized membrane protein YidH (DUF202 family)
MKPTGLIGILLIILGVIALAYQGINYTTREKAIDIGPVQVTTEKNHNIPFAPIVGITMLISGAGLVVVSLKRG